MRAQRLTLVGLVLAITASLLFLPETSALAASRCFGQRPTKTGTNGSDRLNGTPRRDVIVGRGGNDLLVGFGGNDLLCGEGGNDTLVGVGGKDRLAGDGGFDVLLGMEGADRASGGPGVDLLSFFYSRSGVSVRLSAGRARGEGNDRFGSIENIEGSKRRDRLIGNGKGNLINGGNGSDRLFGRGKSDLLLGRGGRDRMVGGEGRDLASYYFSNGVNGDLAAGVVRGEGRDRLRGIEGLEGSRRASDRLSGDGRRNSLLGGNGRDSLFGMGDVDYVEGGGGNDLRIVGGAGDDFLVGSGGNDNLGAAGTGMEPGRDFLRGSSGDDRLFGGDGQDLLEGSAGDDLFDGGLDFDYATYIYAPRRITADIAAGEATGWGRDSFASDPLPTIEGLQGSIHNDRLTGSSVANSLYGLKGNDEMFGLEGNDLLEGNLGDDDLDGGLGIDTCKTGEQKTGCELPLFGTTSAARGSEVVRPPRHDDLVFEGPVEGAVPFLHPTTGFVGSLTARRF